MLFGRETVPPMCGVLCVEYVDCLVGECNGARTNRHISIQHNRNIVTILADHFDCDRVGTLSFIYRQIRLDFRAKPSNIFGNVSSGLRGTVGVVGDHRALFEQK